ncbi:MAG: hypothetical protein J6C82_06615 [Clostridia bacterium]|nr:hypothetical protein [Clostridia bacterium]
MKILILIIYITVIGQGCFFFGLALPRKKIDENKFPYKAFLWEQNGKFYDRFRVKKWKTKVPDMSVLTNKIFPKKLHGDMTSDDIDRLIKESCIAEMIHYILCVLSIGIYHIWKGKIGIVLTVLYNLLGNLPYIIIQRYNRPHFIELRERLKIREERRVNG